MTTNEILAALDKVIPNPICALDYNKDYELLIAVMLSAQSTDKRVNMVTKELFKYDINELAEMEASEIEKIIKPVGTQKRKSEYVKRICQILLDKTDGKVPLDREFIESLPGIGHKTCNVVLSEIYDVPAIAVDTHVSRVSKRLGFAGYLDDVVKIEEKLCKKFPKEKWGRLHLQLVLFGRHYCKSQKPLCDGCPFSKICTYKNL